MPAVLSLFSLLVAQAGFPGQWAPPGERHRITNSKACLQKMTTDDDRAACLSRLTNDFGLLGRYVEVNADLPLPKPHERRVVFFGDSITDAWSRPEHGGFFPGKPYINRGIGGQTTDQMLLRFRADVIALRPKVVVILAGTNDLARNPGPTVVERVQGNLSTMAELARAHQIRVVLASLLPVCDCTKTPDGNAIIRTVDRPPEKIRALNAWMADYAKKNRHQFLDYHAAMADPEGALRASLTNDGLHPDARGYAVMAPLAERAIAKTAK